MLHTDDFNWGDAGKAGLDGTGNCEMGCSTAVLMLLGAIAFIIFAFRFLAENAFYT